MFRGARGRSPEEAFLAELAAALEVAPGVAGVERLGPMQLGVTMHSGDPRTANLHNLFAETRAIGAGERSARIAAFVRAMTITDEEPSDWAAARTRVMPSLRAVAWRAAVPGQKRPAYRLLAPFVDHGLAVDFPDSMMLVSDDHLASWGVEFDHAAQQATANLARSGLPIGAAAVAGCLAVGGPEGYVSSWLLVPEAFERASTLLGGPVVALAPRRDVCLFAPTGDERILGSALSWARQTYSDTTRHLSPVPYQMAGSTLVPWQPPAGHPLARRAAMAEHVLAFYEYEHQKNVLRELFEKAGEDVGVGELTLVRRDDGSPLSVACWPEGSNALLPFADAIVFLDRGAKERVRVSFDDACAALSELVEPVAGMYPPRIRVSGLPPSRLGALRGLTRV